MSHVTCRYVIEPYHRYPNLLDILFNFLKTEQTSGVRREVVRVLGLLGALDPYKHTQHQRNENRSKMGTPTSKPMDKKSQGTGKVSSRPVCWGVAVVSRTLHFFLC